MTRRRRPRNGTAAVELALLLPILTVLVAAAVDYARVFHAVQVLSTAASAGAAYASGTSWSPASTTTPAAAGCAAALNEGAQLAPPLGSADVSVTVDATRATVTVVHDFPLLLGSVLGQPTVRLSRTSVYRVAPRTGD